VVLDRQRLHVIGIRCHTEFLASLRSTPCRRAMVLTQHQEAFIGELVRSGRYSNASEVLRESLRLMERRESLEAAKLDYLHGRLDEAERDALDGVASGTPSLGRFEVEQAGKTLVYLAEDSLPAVRNRIGAVEAARPQRIRSPGNDGRGGSSGEYSREAAFTAAASEDIRACSIEWETTGRNSPIASRVPPSAFADCLWPAGDLFHRRRGCAVSWAAETCVVRAG
jgi:putative addiction module CopG family antidote